MIDLFSYNISDLFSYKSILYIIAWVIFFAETAYYLYMRGWNDSITRFAALFMILASIMNAQNHIEIKLNDLNTKIDKFLEQNN